MKRAFALSCLLAGLLAMTAHAGLLGDGSASDALTPHTEGGISGNIMHFTEYSVYDYDMGAPPYVRDFVEKVPQGETDGAAGGTAQITDGDAGGTLSVNAGYRYEDILMGSQIESACNNYAGVVNRLFQNVVIDNPYDWQSGQPWSTLSIHHCYLETKAFYMGDWSPVLRTHCGPMVQSDPACPGDIPPGV